MEESLGHSVDSSSGEWKGSAKKSPLISRNPDVLSGTAVFVGTRVPVQNPIDCLEGGYSIDEFLDDFPSVSRAQVIQFLELALIPH
jgi:uncharacterized protein (DUF433 family)